MSEANYYPDLEERLRDAALRCAPGGEYFDILTEAADAIAKLRSSYAGDLVAGANRTLTVDDPGGTITISASGGGGGTMTLADLLKRIDRAKP